LFFELGVDGQFSGLPDTAAAVRDEVFGAPVGPPRRD
jgi:hypothetical protein